MDIDRLIFKTFILYLKYRIFFFLFEGFIIWHLIVCFVLKIIKKIQDFLKTRNAKRRYVNKNFDHNSCLNDFRFSQYEVLYNKSVTTNKEANLRELSNFLLQLLSQIVKNQISSDVSMQFFKEIKGMNILNSTMLVELIWIIGFIFS